MGMTKDGLSYWQADTQEIDLLDTTLGDLLDSRAGEIPGRLAVLAAAGAGVDDAHGDQRQPVVLDEQDADPVLELEVDRRGRRVARLGAGLGDLVPRDAGGAPRHRDLRRPRIGRDGSNLPQRSGAVQRPARA